LQKSSLKLIHIPSYTVWKLLLPPYGLLARLRNDQNTLLWLK
jgi:hypothetical protein